MEAQESSKSNGKAANKRDMSVIGIITILTQAGISYHSDQTVTHELSYVKEEIQHLRLEREQYFVRKSELESISKKIDQINDKVNSLSSQVAAIKAQLMDIYTLTEENESHHINAAFEEIQYTDQIGGTIE